MKQSRRIHMSHSISPGKMRNEVDKINTMSPEEATKYMGALDKRRRRAMRNLKLQKK